MRPRHDRTPPNHSARNWTIGIGGLAAILALVFFGVPPGNLLNSLQLIDRLTGRDTPPSTSTSTPALPPLGTTNSGPSSTTSWSPPDVSYPSTTGRPPAEDPPPIAQAPPSTTSEAPPPIPVVDRIQIDTWAYQKTGLNTYRASNNGSLSIRVDWTASANGYGGVNGACASSVRIQGGPNTDQAKDSSNCSDSRSMDVRQPGNYRVTVTAHQDSGGAEYSDSIDVTVLPG